MSKSGYNEQDFTNYENLQQVEIYCKQRLENIMKRYNEDYLTYEEAIRQLNQDYSLFEHAKAVYKYDLFLNTRN